jgi:hypothetical protein
MKKSLRNKFRNYTIGEDCKIEPVNKSIINRRRE